MVLPTGLRAEHFDEWYLGTHTLYGKASLGIVRYTVNRAFSLQPPAARGELYCIAQEYWQDWSSFEACWNSPSGHAVLGDGLVNIDLDPRYSRSIHWRRPATSSYAADKLQHDGAWLPRQYRRETCKVSRLWRG